METNILHLSTLKMKFWLSCLKEVHAKSPGASDNCSDQFENQNAMNENHNSISCHLSLITEVVNN